MPPTADNPFNVTMTHDELATDLGAETVAKIEGAGFVLVPREWRERVFKILNNRKES